MWTQSLWHRAAHGKAQEGWDRPAAECVAFWQNSSHQKPEEMWGITRSLLALGSMSPELLWSLCPANKYSSGRRACSRLRTRGSAWGTPRALGGWFSLLEQIVSVMQRQGGWVGREPAGLFLQLAYTRTWVWELFFMGSESQ